MEPVLEKGATDEFLRIVVAQSKLGRGLFDREPGEKLAKYQKLEGRVRPGVRVDNAEIRNAKQTTLSALLRNITPR